jgi:hypothetical protein
VIEPLRRLSQCAGGEGEFSIFTANQGETLVSRNVSKKWAVAAWTAFLLWAVAWAAIPATADCGGACQVRSRVADEAGRRARAAARSTPHHGQVTKVNGGSIEVVYLPKETRVYLYDPTGQSLSAAKAEGEVTLKVENKWKEVFRFAYPLTYAAAAEAAKDHQDYLSAAADVNNVRDGYMDVYVRLTGLPYERPDAKFSQVFASSILPPLVTVVALDKADQAAIARQKTCPVTGAALGSMGDPIKVLVEDRGSLYVCCKNCLVSVEEMPDSYLAKVAHVREAK